MRVTLRANGEIELWLDHDRPMADVAFVLHTIADGLLDNPERVA